MQSLRSSLDLVATVLLATLAALGSLGAVIQVALAVLLIFVLPGYALTVILLRPGSSDPGERLAYTVALSLATTALAGLAAYVFVDLDRTVWGLGLALVTCVAALVAMLVRWSNLELEPSVSLPPLGARNGLWYSTKAGFSAILIGVAIAIAAGAVVIASTEAENTRAESRFTELWILPTIEATTFPPVPAASIGVQSHEGSVSSFRLRVAQGSDQLLNRTIILEDGESWDYSIPIEDAEAGRVRAILLNEDEIVRRVHLKQTGKDASQ